jgi:hypothetical protein
LRVAFWWKRDTDADEGPAPMIVVYDEVSVAKAES